METQKLLVGCPIRGREEIASAYLNYLYQQTYPKDKISLAFCLNNSIDRTGEILHQFAQEHSSEYARIDILEINIDNSPPFDRATEGRTERHFEVLAEIRNIFLTMLHDEEGIVSVDSDIFLIDPDTILKLVQHHQDIISALVQNGPKPHCDHNIMMWLNAERTHGTHYRKELPSTLLECDVTGACYYISRRVIESGVRYGNHCQGEDTYFCQRAQEHGFHLYCDPTIATQHLLA